MGSWEVAGCVPDNSKQGRHGIVSFAVAGVSWPDSTLQVQQPFQTAGFNNQSEGFNNHAAVTKKMDSTTKRPNNQGFSNQKKRVQQLRSNSHTLLKQATKCGLIVAVMSWRCFWWCLGDVAVSVSLMLWWLVDDVWVMSRPCAGGVSGMLQWFVGAALLISRWCFVRVFHECFGDISEMFSDALVMCRFLGLC